MQFDDKRSLSEINESIVNRIMDLNNNQMSKKEAEEAAQNLLGFCYSILDGIQEQKYNTDKT